MMEWRVRHRQPKGTETAGPSCTPPRRPSTRPPRIEHLEQALGPATVDELVETRRAIGEQVYISTNVSESPQIVRSIKTGRIDTRSTAALTATKVIAAIEAGADVVKVGFAHLAICEDRRS